MLCSLEGQLPSLTEEHYTTLDRLARDERSSLFCRSIIEKKTFLTSAQGRQTKLPVRQPHVAGATEDGHLSGRISTEIPSDGISDDKILRIRIRNGVDAGDCSVRIRRKPE